MAADLNEVPWTASNLPIKLEAAVSNLELLLHSEAIFARAGTTCNLTEFNESRGGGSSSKQPEKEPEQREV